MLPDMVSVDLKRLAQPHGDAHGQQIHDQISQVTVKEPHSMKKDGDNLDIDWTACVGVAEHGGRKHHHMGVSPVQNSDGYDGKNTSTESIKYVTMSHLLLNNS